MNETVETIDVMPTVLSLCALDAPKEIQGRSLRPLLAPSGAGASGAAAADSAGWNNRRAFTQKATSKDHGGAPPPDNTESFAVTLDGWKLIHHTKLPPAGKEFELFEIEKDPLNATDVAAAHPEIVQRLSELIDAWRKETQAARLASDEQANKDISPEDLERLRSLGYVQ